MKLNYDDLALLELAILDAIEAIDNWTEKNGKKGGYYNDDTVASFEDLYERVTAEQRDTPVPVPELTPLDEPEREWRVCASCEYRYLPTLSTPSKCSDCTRRSYK